VPRAGRRTLVLRNDDLDATRFRLDFVGAMLEDLRWLGFAWQEARTSAGRTRRINQSARRAHYRAAPRKTPRGAADFSLHALPARRARRHRRPHEGAGATTSRCIPGIRPARRRELPPLGSHPGQLGASRVPMVRRWALSTGALARSSVSGRDFGDFLVWRRRRAELPARVARSDDAEMAMTEVVRGAT